MIHDVGCVLLRWSISLNLLRFIKSSWKMVGDGDASTELSHRGARVRNNL